MLNYRWLNHGRLNFSRLVLCFLPTLLAAQQKSDLQQILDRLERLERENHNLAAEVRSLRAELTASRTAQPTAQPAEAEPPSTAPPLLAPLDERVAVIERRIDEQAQTKVEASQKLPIALTGMVLFNAFLNGRAANGVQNPVAASLQDSSTAAGASLSQSIIGLKFQGPEVLWGGHVNGALYMDFFGGTSSSLNHLVRLRVASVEIDWKNTTFMVGQDKPIISPREPNSLAQVGESPLTAAGNPWLWQPQARIEQRFSLGKNAGVKAQMGVYQTSEVSYLSRGGDHATPASPPRPGIEGRFEFWRRFGEGARIEIAPGFHTSDTHVEGFSVPSRLASVDWMIQPFSKLQFSGMLFHGQNAAGIGAIRQGFTIVNDTQAVGIGATGGWGQLSYLATKRLSFNIYGGEEADAASNLLAGDIHRNLAYAGNAIYRLGSNVLIGLEASQVRTDYFKGPIRLNNHYDLSLGYLF